MPDPRPPRDARRRPAPGEFAAYYGPYIAAVPDGDVLETLRSQLATVSALLERVPADRVSFRYAEGKWTTREVFGHVLDMEWVFTLRALHFARGDTNALPGVDQNVFMGGANFAHRPLADLLEEWRHLRSANLRLFASFDDTLLDRTGTASGNHFSVRALVFIVAGHMAHHLGVIRERYLG